MQWEKGTEVRRYDNPGKIGMTTGQTRQRASGLYVQVRWHQDGSTEYEAEDQIEGLDSVELQDQYAVLESGRFGRAADLRRNLTQAHLSGRLANLVYSMGVTNTDFYPHQYRPLLTLLESPADGLLIADEVGLGKTVEAGLIWTELRAREDMRRLLIVCPAMLTDKWQEELRHRFGIDATVINAKTLNEELRKSSPYGPMKAWIASYHSLRPPKTWRPPSELPAPSKSNRAILADLLTENEGGDPLIDLVVFDEAHYMRNPASSAHRLGELLREVSHCRVLLSATPINLDNQDLYQLLRLCDPEHFQYQSNFTEMIEANRPLVKGRDAALRRDGTAEEILQHLRDAAMTPLLSESRQLASLLADPPTDETLKSSAYRADLAANLERVNLLGHVLTRTRKRDVQLHRPVREVRRESVPMTDAERRFYEFVTEATRDYAWSRGISDGFLLATPQRQVCSCPAAFAQAWIGGDAALIEDLAQTVLDEVEELDEEADYDDISTSLKEFLLRNRPRDLDLKALELDDSKFNRLLTVAKAYFGENPGEKLVIFSSYRGTVQYLQSRLAAEGVGAMLIWGNMNQSKQEVINEFADRNDIRVLVSTEVAAEGVDLQFCRVLVNYDLPWNPMRIEQRIGRIDRLGQKADKIHIWNLFYERTIDERILGRLLERLHVFTASLGEPEPIIGETIQRLEAALLTSKLTPEEEETRIADAAQALENIRQRQEELEANAAQMIAHGGLVLDRISAAQELARCVTEKDLLIFVQDFLQRSAPGYQLAQDAQQPHLFTIQLPPKTAAELDDFARQNGMAGQTALGNGLARTCRFLNKIAGVRERHIETIHQFHPLIRFIAKAQREGGQTQYPVVAMRIRQGVMGDALSAGRYMFTLRKWVFQGVKSEEVLASAAIDLGTGRELDEAMAETLVNSARLDADDWLEAASVIDSRALAEQLDHLEDQLEQRYRIAVRRKQDENSDRAMFQLHGLDRHLQGRLSALESTRQLHANLNRSGLVKATQGRIDKLKARMEMRREQIKRQQRIEPDNKFVCCGVIEVVED
ncbi:SNF2-related protein [Variovorax sp. LjRoot178]|uniref:SNF2-related protein n=1 Tax=Variovorax sp. LjRoot178 TaxID=3342277 RepID=UPI003ECEB96B